MIFGVSLPAKLPRLTSVGRIAPSQPPRSKYLVRLRDGTINGASAPTGELFHFLLWANDGDNEEPAEEDTFRIKIWYEDGGEVVVYDNGFNRVIGGGSIVIHTGGKKGGK